MAPPQGAARSPVARSAAMWRTEQLEVGLGLTRLLRVMGLGEWVIWRGGAGYLGCLVASVPPERER